jgi:hypothetical protein
MFLRGLGPADYAPEEVCGFERVGIGEDAFGLTLGDETADNGGSLFTDPPFDRRNASF